MTVPLSKSLPIFYVIFSSFKIFLDTGVAEFSNYKFSAETLHSPLRLKTEKIYFFQFLKFSVLEIFSRRQSWGPSGHLTFFSTYKIEPSDPVDIMDLEEHRDVRLNDVFNKISDLLVAEQQGVTQPKLLQPSVGQNGKALIPPKRPK